MVFLRFIPSLLVQRSETGGITRTNLQGSALFPDCTFANLHESVAVAKDNVSKSWTSSLHSRVCSICLGLQHIFRTFVQVLLPEATGATMIFLVHQSHELTYAASVGYRDYQNVGFATFAFDYGRTTNIRGRCRSQRQYLHYS